MMKIENIEKEFLNAVNEFRSHWNKYPSYVVLNKHTEKILKDKYDHKIACNSISFSKMKIGYVSVTMIVTDKVKNIHVF